jgi:hypothetical protein
VIKWKRTRIFCDTIIGPLELWVAINLARALQTTHAVEGRDESDVKHPNSVAKNHTRRHFDSSKERYRSRAHASYWDHMRLDARRATRHTPPRGLAARTPSETKAHHTRRTPISMLSLTPNISCMSVKGASRARIAPTQTSSLLSLSSSASVAHDMQPSMGVQCAGGRRGASGPGVTPRLGPAGRRQKYAESLTWRQLSVRPRAACRLAGQEQASVAASPPHARSVEWGLRNVVLGREARLSTIISSPPTRWSRLRTACRAR